LFKKFVIADGLAWFALSDILAGDVYSQKWLWFFFFLTSTDPSTSLSSPVTLAIAYA
jgi:hypothetical protein